MRLPFNSISMIAACFHLTLVSFPRALPVTIDQKEEEGHHDGEDKYSHPEAVSTRPMFFGIRHDGKLDRFPSAQRPHKVRSLDLSNGPSPGKLASSCFPDDHYSKPICFSCGI